MDFQSTVSKAEFSPIADQTAINLSTNTLPKLPSPQTLESLDSRVWEYGDESGRPAPGNLNFRGDAQETE